MKNRYVLKYDGDPPPLDNKMDNVSIEDSESGEDLINGCGDCGSPWSDDLAGLIEMVRRANAWEGKA